MPIVSFQFTVREANIETTIIAAREIMRPNVLNRSEKITTEPRIRTRTPQ